jgi:hypothetical protein
MLKKILSFGNGRPVFVVLLSTALMITGCLAGTGKASQKANPPSDFSYDLNDDGTGVIIRQYRGMGRYVVIPEEIEGYPVVGIHEFAFISFNIDSNPIYSPMNVTSVVFPDSITDLGIRFSLGSKNNNYITHVKLPENITKISPATFENCDSLNNIVIPAGVTTIGDYAFYSCDSLNNIVIPAGVTAIGDHAFAFCSSLSDLTVSDGITNISADAFLGCGTLKLATRKKLQDLGYEGSF